MADEEVVDQDQQEQISPELDIQARDMGWRPKDEFKGADDKWVDAKTFVERGEHVLPIVKATADRLRKDLAAERARADALEAAVTAGQQSIAALEKYHQDDVKQKVDKARADLKEQLKAAKKSGDVDAEVELTDSLGKLNAAEDAAATRDTTTVTTKKQDIVDHTKNPIFLEWKNENPWFGPGGDKAKTAIAYQVSLDIKAMHPELKGRDYLDKVVEETNKELVRLGVGKTTPSRKVEASRGGAGGNSGGNGAGKGWTDLPADAKAACDSYRGDLVGKDRRYKTDAEWRAAYAKQYFAEV